MTRSRTHIVAGTLLVATITAGATAGIAAPPATRKVDRVSRTPTWPRLDTAAPFLLQSIRDKVDGRWDAAWQNLYPRHKLIVSKTTFVHCESKTPFPAPLESIRVARVRRAPVRVPGLAHPLAGVAVTVYVELTWYGPRDPITLTPTFHLLPVRGHWTWLLSAERYRLYLHQGCDTPPAA